MILIVIDGVCLWFIGIPSCDHQQEANLVANTLHWQNRDLSDQDVLFGPYGSMAVLHSSKLRTRPPAGTRNCGEAHKHDYSVDAGTPWLKLRDENKYDAL